MADNESFLAYLASLSRPPSARPSLSQTQPWFCDFAGAAASLSDQGRASCSQSEVSQMDLSRKRKTPANCVTNTLPFAGGLAFADPGILPPAHQTFLENTVRKSERRVQKAQYKLKQARLHVDINSRGVDLTAPTSAPSALTPAPVAPPQTLPPYIGETQTQHHLPDLSFLQDPPCGAWVGNALAPQPSPLDGQQLEPQSQTHPQPSVGTDEFDLDALLAASVGLPIRDTHCGDWQQSIDGDGQPSYNEQPATLCSGVFSRRPSEEEQLFTPDWTQLPTNFAAQQAATGDVDMMPCDINGQVTDLQEDILKAMVQPTWDPCIVDNMAMLDPVRIPSTGVPVPDQYLAPQSHFEPFTQPHNENDPGSARLHPVAPAEQTGHLPSWYLTHSLPPDAQTSAPFPASLYVSPSYVPPQPATHASTVPHPAATRHIVHPPAAPAAPPSQPNVALPPPPARPLSPILTFVPAVPTIDIQPFAPDHFEPALIGQMSVKDDEFHKEWEGVMQRRAGRRKEKQR